MPGPDYPPSDLRIVVGLGNPGEDYDGTRHNLGFEVLDRLAGDLGLRFARQPRERGLGPIRARVTGGTVVDRTDEQQSFLLVKPMTYMNDSGSAVAAYARHHGVPPASIFVILDDLSLPLGRMRIRPGGSPGGHNGLKSLCAHLGTEGFPRLRMGIAISDLATSDMADPDYVLERFSEEERRLLEPALESATEAARAWLRGCPLEELMNRYNVRGGATPAGDGDRPSE